MGLTKKKLLSISISLTLMILIYSAWVLAKPGLPIIDKSQLEKGLITIKYDTEEKADYMLRVTKGMKSYDYKVVPGGQYSLQMGNGLYKIFIGELVTGRTYKQVLAEEIKLELGEPNIVFLQSTYMIKWHDQNKAIIQAQELTKNAKSDEEKAALIYNYIVDKISYDYELAATVQTGYIPDIDVTYAKATGICYDYATIMAGMLRSVGVPTKLVTGFHKDDVETYHAWNKVYYNGKWQIIDTTYDAVKVQAGYKTPMFQKEADYIAAYKEY